MNMPTNSHAYRWTITGIIFGCVIALAALIFQSVYHFYPERPTSLARSVLELLEEVKDAEIGQRGFLIAGQDSFLEPYNAALPRIRAHLVEMREIGGHDSQRAEKLRVLMLTKLDEMAWTISERRAGSGVAFTIKIPNIAKGKATMDQIRAVVAEIVAAEDHHVVVGTIAQTAVTILIVVIVVCVVITLIQAYFANAVPKDAGTQPGHGESREFYNGA
jgi:CHASE3 domain sensor protein